MESKARRRRPGGMPQAISGRLREYIRDYWGGNQSEFSRRVCVPRTTVTGWMSHHPHTPDIGQLAAIASRGNVNLNWLLLGEEPRLRGAPSAPQEAKAGLRAALVAELVARAGGAQGSREVIERVVPEPDALLKLLLEHHLPWIQKLLSPIWIMAGAVPVEMKDTERPKEADWAPLRDQVRALFPFVDLGRLPE